MGLKTVVYIASMLSKLENGLRTAGKKGNSDVLKNVEGIVTRAIPESIGLPFTRRFEKLDHFTLFYR